MREPQIQRGWLARVLEILCALSLSTAALAAVEAEQLSTPELQARYEVLIEELRCPKCQNQNLADSDALVAKDLRREIRRLLEEGFTDGEVTDYMVARYGDFVLYRPPLQRNTLALWLAPGIFGAIGLLALIVIVLRSRTGVEGGQQDAGGALTEGERQRLRQLLGDEIDESAGSGADKK
ncbi:cytochrome c-type biogenesis protein CcmH [Microbulbifer thermotolerans]|uniref:cytochrome c-type biogenesis protein n=1 Tax=Microbulbifer thermotolerans TaxID=252514 RepID=UPI0022496EF3|nr:cytochrome c-type biogenesis protein [Microbulbifer thermotolerans]MCX2794613.1 cytochrome c-type biogenesis protein CcmH [Microbulbifer thermotolerans]